MNYTSNRRSTCVPWLRIWMLSNKSTTKVLLTKVLLTNEQCSLLKILYSVIKRERKQFLQLKEVLGSLLSQQRIRFSTLSSKTFYHYLSFRSRTSREKIFFLFEILNLKVNFLRNRRYRASNIQNAHLRTGWVFRLCVWTSVHHYSVCH